MRTRKATPSTLDHTYGQHGTTDEEEQLPLALELVSRVPGTPAGEGDAGCTGTGAAAGDGDGDGAGDGDREEARHMTGTCGFGMGDGERLGCGDDVGLVDMDTCPAGGFAAAVCLLSSWLLLANTSRCIMYSILVLNPSSTDTRRNMCWMRALARPLMCTCE